MWPLDRSSSYFVREPRGISMKTSTLSSAAPRARGLASARAALLTTCVLPRVLRRRYDHRDLALWPRGSIPSGKVGRRAADDLLVDLGQLARDRDARVRRDRRDVREEVCDAERTFVEDRGAALIEQLRDLPPPRAALLLGEADDRELPRRQAGRDEGGGPGGRPRHRDHLGAGRDAGRHERPPG